MSTSFSSQGNNIETEWSVFAGGPSAGKTTVAKLLESRGVVVKYDVVRQYIEEHLSKGQSLDIIRGEAIQFHKKIADLFEISESTLPVSQSCILENGMPDVLAYLNLWVNEIPEDIYCRVLSHRKRYKNVFIFEPLAAFERDGVRAENEDMAREVFANALHFYEKTGYTPLIVPRFCDDKNESIARRIEYISQFL